MVVDAHFREHRFFGRHLEDGLMMAMAVDEGLARKLRQTEVRRLVFQKFAKQKNLTGELLCTFVLGK